MVEVQCISCYLSYITIRDSLTSQPDSWRGPHGEPELEKSNNANEGIICSGPTSGLWNHRDSGVSLRSATTEDSF